MIIASFATALGFALVGTQHLAPLVFLAYALTACVWTPMVPLTDAYALRGVARYGLNYGPLRLWGSAAFVVGALACGLLVDVIAARYLIWVIAALAELGAAVLVAVPVGIVCHRVPRLRAGTLGTLNLIQTIPSIALFGILMAPLGALAAAVPFVTELDFAITSVSDPSKSITQMFLSTTPGYTADGRYFT